MKWVATSWSDGSSENGAHTWNELVNSICVIVFVYIDSSLKCEIDLFKDMIFFTHAQCVLRSHISTMDECERPRFYVSDMKFHYQY